MKTLQLIFTTGHREDISVNRDHGYRLWQVVAYRLKKRGHWWGGKLADVRVVTARDE